ncbi:uncharacterized protein LOC126894933 [Daktulosphaira vitifoliae]|uniref:uncharacterized protein LOC126894933 n=1 Tax=Daktulosphaira vitifoliae TaxID=58002 RepID=UPI0021AA3D6F|nr:uncharacterized protein LOC126894933 [Daktulosphaira vitifoliae]
MKILIYLRLVKGNQIMNDCLQHYGFLKPCVWDEDKTKGYYSNREYSPPSHSDIKRRKIESDQYFRKYTVELLNDVISGTHTPNFMVKKLMYKVPESYHDQPFAKYCVAAYYTYLVTDDPILDQILQLVEKFITETNNVKSEFLP